MKMLLCGNYRCCCCASAVGGKSKVFTVIVFIFLLGLFIFSLRDLRDEDFSSGSGTLSKLFPVGAINLEMYIRGSFHLHSLKSLTNTARGLARRFEDSHAWHTVRSSKAMPRVPKRVTQVLRDQISDGCGCRWQMERCPKADIGVVRVVGNIHSRSASSMLRGFRDLDVHGDEKELIKIKHRRDLLLLSSPPTFPTLGGPLRCLSHGVVSWRQAESGTPEG